MTKSLITERELCLINMAVCDQGKMSFSVSRPHNVRLVISQLNQLHDADFTRKVAHMAYMIKKLSPFTAGNTKTAVLGAYYMYMNNEKDAPAGLNSLGGLLKHDVSIEAIEKVMSS